MKRKVEKCKQKKIISILTLNLPRQTIEPTFEDLGINVNVVSDKNIDVHGLFLSKFYWKLELSEIFL